jgi:alginate O-acetyltransferase complex protein AlgI
LNSTLAIAGILAYSLQIYFDFSGYSDMAIGIGNMLGYRAMENFDSPYVARTVGDFWKRWHISLTKFFTTYIYIPLGGNRKGLARTCINIVIVFTISGLWHGADWTFVAWGAAYGVILAAERILKIGADKVPAFLGRAVTFAVVTLLWVLFRADTFRGALDILREVLAFDFQPLPQNLLAAMHVPELDLAVGRLGLPESFYNAWPWLVLAFAFAVTQLNLNSRRICERKLYLKKPVFALLVVLGVLSVLSFSGNTSFIYWRF